MKGRLQTQGIWKMQYRQRLIIGLLHQDDGNTQYILLPVVEG